MRTYESWQDFYTTMARISCITLAGPQRHRAWRHENNRTMVAEQQTCFERELHNAMGWKPSTVQDWA